MQTIHQEEIKPTLNTLNTLINLLTFGHFYLLLNNLFTQIQSISYPFPNNEGLIFYLKMDYIKKISTTSKQCNYLQNKPMNEQVRQLLIEDLKKKKNKQNKLMNKKKLLHKKTK